jgi:hypothetical protein
MSFSYFYFERRKQKMNKQALATFVKNTQEWANKHTPEILTGFGIAGMLTTTVLAVKATPKALKLIEDKKEELGTDKLTVWETVKTTWKPYVPVVITGAVSTTCLIGACSVSTRRNAALATAYQLTTNALNEYKDKTLEMVGEKKEKAIREAIDKDRIEKNPVSRNEVIITEKGQTLCFDPISARYFKSDIDKIKKAENELNKRMLHDITGYASVNDFYDELGLDHIMIGDELGWNVGDLIDISFSSQLTDDDQPCLVLDFLVAPKRNYTTFM